MVDDRLRVVVTGGAGFIGGHMVRHYLTLSADVLALDDLSSGRRVSVPADAKFARVDVAQAEVIERIVQFRPDLIIHAAAQVSVPRSLQEPERDRWVNVEGTSNIVEAARRGGGRVVFLSSGGAIYGNADGATEIDPIAPISPYGWHKLEAEAIVRQAPYGYGIARLANVYGPGQRSDLEGGVVAVFLERLRRGESVEVHGSGRQRRDLVYVRDVVGALESIARTEQCGLWNVATGVATSIAELLGRLRALLRVETPTRFVDARPGDVDVSRLAIDRIRADLGWQPTTSLEVGLSTLVLPRRSGHGRQSARTL